MVKRKHKRGNEKYRPKPIRQERKNKFFPVIWCIHENKVIGMSSLVMKFKADQFGRVTPKYKVRFRHWKKDVCEFLGDEYFINMREYNDGDIILCPKCGYAVDFRLFPSSDLPKFVKQHDKKDNTPELPNT